MRVCLILIACFLASVSHACAAEPVFIEDMTWQEVGQAIQAGKRTVIIPTGGTEQNGPHMVTGKHNYIIHATAERIARALGNTLVAPVLAYVPEGAISPPEGHMRFAGTISLSDDTYEKLLTEVARSFKQHGFTLICFLGDSGPNQAPQQRVAETLTKEWEKDGVRVLQVGDYYDSHNGQDDWLLKQGEKKDDIEGHAALSDTSELLAVHPAGIRKSLLVPHTQADYDKTGVTASSAHASKSYGKKLLELKVNAAVRQIRAAMH